MRIDSSNLSLQSQSTFEYSHSTSTSMQFHYGNSQRNPNVEDKNMSNSVSLSFSASLSIESSTRVAYEYEKDMSPEDRLKKKIIEELLGMFYGKHMKELVHPKDKNPPVDNQALHNHNNPYENRMPTSNNRALGIVFETQEAYYQKQTVDFSANVQINTPNRNIELSLSISFSKELYESHSSRLVIGDEKVIDPLIINFDEDINPFDNLSNLKFEFDLNNDGKDEWIPLLKNGAGFLSLDKNSNGKIDNGSELFGTKTGDGFKELEAYDDDKNNWIDENDEVFNKLKIWQKDDEDNAKLVSLLDLNVGAIYLGDVQSGYKYQNSIDSTDAVQKSNSVFVKEDGSSAGVVNSIDIVV